MRRKSPNIRCAMVQAYHPGSSFSGEQKKQQTIGTVTKCTSYTYNLDGVAPLRSTYPSTHLFTANRIGSLFSADSGGSNLRVGGHWEEPQTTARIRRVLSDEPKMSNEGSVAAKRPCTGTVRRRD